MRNKVLGFLMLGCFATAALAQGTKPGKGPDMTTEQRQKMAEAHEKMATCLRSDRPLPDCRDEMMKSCQTTMGGSCPMMGGMMGSMKQPSPMMQPGQTK
jgi:hypothetical protein